jgi:predicted RNA binding protein YcfA (HicA-like mRNA interferase family)
MHAFVIVPTAVMAGIRSDDPFIGRLGLREIDVNKLLEKNGFVKVRDRRRGPHAPCSEDDEESKDAGSGKKVPKGSSLSSTSRSPLAMHCC